MQRNRNRKFDEIRPVTFSPGFIPSADGSVLVTAGDTRVICTATIEEKVPFFLENTDYGWVTAEYGMLPASVPNRMRRDKANASGRSQEIQRLIGRSLRCAVDRKLLGQRTITIDCDVLQADGGTRTAAINGGFIALAMACDKMLKDGRLDKNPIVHTVSAISLGIVDSELLLDLEFVEDSAAEVDANLVCADAEFVVELQTSSEHGLLPLDAVDSVLALGLKGIRDIKALQDEVLRTLSQGA